MDTGSPSIAKIMTMVLFALSCIGLLLFLWLSFGGTLPFNPAGLWVQGVVHRRQPARRRGRRPDRRRVGRQGDHQAAGSRGQPHDRHDPDEQQVRADPQGRPRDPAREDDPRRDLRAADPGHAREPADLPDGALLARSQVTNAVQLDQIFDALDPKTRAAFRSWQQQLAIAVKGNDQNISNVIGNLPQFAADTTDLLQVLDIQHTAVVRLVQNGGTVFAALNKDPSALRNLITSAETTFHTTAANNNAIAATFHVFPTFLDETKATMTRLQGLRAGHRPAGQEARAGRQQPQADADRRARAVAVAALVLHPPRPADHRLQDRAAGDPRHAQRRDPAAGLGRPVPGAAQPDPDLAVHAPAADLGLHLQRRRRPGRQDDQRSAATAPATICASSRRSGPETLSFAANRDAANRGNTYPPPLWLADKNIFSAGGKYPGSFALPSWDCNNTGAPGDGSQPTKHGRHPQPDADRDAGLLGRARASPALLGQSGKFPHVTAAHYSNK